MRILVAHNVPRARQGGMSRIMGFIHDVVARAGHDVDYLTSDDLPPRFGGAAARLAFPALVARRALAAKRAGRGYDILNVHEPSAAPAALLRRAGLLPPLVVTSHGLEQRAWALAVEEAKLGRQGPSRRARWFHPPTVLTQARTALALADRVFVLNSDDAMALRERGRDASAILRIFPGASDVYAAAASARDYGECRSVLFAGTWRKNKGIEDLVPAMQLLWRDRPNLTLTIFGAGVPDAAVLHAFGAAASRVRLVSAATDEEAARIYASAGLFVLPSLFEGTPLVLMEAMASGLPIVTTRTCGMKDVIDDGRNGLLVPMRDPAAVAGALGRLAADAGLRAALGRAARADAARSFTWDRVAQPVLETYLALHAHG